MTVARAIALGLSLAVVASSPASAQRGLLSRLPLEARIADLARPDAHTREEAARALACIGPAERVAPELARVLVAEAVPETRAALVYALARRGQAPAAPALVAAWDHGSPSEREHVLDGLAAIATEEALSFVVDRLASELHRPGACARLGRLGDPGIDLVAHGLAVPERRDAAALCLAQLSDRERARAALVAIAPTLGGSTLAAALDALDPDPRVISLAAAAVESSDAGVAASALAVLARHAPDRVPLDRWRALAEETDGRGASAVLALVSLDRPLADQSIANVVAQGGARATVLFAALAGAPSSPPGVLVPFVEIEATRAPALDRLAVVPGGGDVLATLPAAPDATLALAIAAVADRRALGPLRARAELLDPAERRHVLAVAGAVDAGECGRGTSPEERLAAAYCLSRAPNGGGAATAWLETEREPSVVAWLALAADGAPSEPALHDLLELEATRLPMLRLVPGAMARASAPERRRLGSTLVRSSRSPHARERAEAIRALGDVADVRHRALVALALEDDAASVRLAAARALALLPADEVTEVRRAGRARIEHDENVRAALDGAPLAQASSPLRLRVHVQGRSAGSTPVEIELADGRVLVLSPVRSEIVLFGVPDRTARVQLLDPERD